MQFMNNAMLLATVAGVALLALVLAVYRARSRAAGSRGLAGTHPRQFGSTSASPEIPEQKRPIAQIENDGWTVAAVRERFLCLAFGVTDRDVEIDSAHLALLQRSRRALDDTVQRAEYFPRRPMLLPQLLRAVNDTDSTRREIAEIVLQDAALTGDVLKLANSPYYRGSPGPIENVEKAVVILGTEGLKAVVATSLMQPIFRVREEYFKNFSGLLWEYSLRAAKAANAYAVRTRKCDRFAAHLIGLIGSTGPLVLFRVLSESYKREPQLVPDAESFIRLLGEHGDRASELIASNWAISEQFLHAMQEQSRDDPPAARTPLGVAAYYSRLCAQLSILADHDVLTTDAAKSCLLSEGLDGDLVVAMWGTLQTQKS